MPSNAAAIEFFLTDQGCSSCNFDDNALTLFQANLKVAAASRSAFERTKARICLLFEQAWRRPNSCVVLVLCFSAQPRQVRLTPQAADASAFCSSSRAQSFESRASLSYCISPRWPCMCAGSDVGAGAAVCECARGLCAIINASDPNAICPNAFVSACVVGRGPYRVVKRDIFPLVVRASCRRGFVTPKANGGHSR